MKAKTIALLGVLGVTVTVAGSMVASRAAQPPLPSYEADVYTTYTTPDGNSFTSAGKVFRGADGSSREDEAVSTTISNRRTKEQILLHKNIKEATVFAVDGASPPEPFAGAKAVPGERRVEDGRIVFRHVVEVHTGMKQEIWLDEEIRALVYMQVTTPTITITKSVRNIQRKAVPTSVFDVPSDYKRVASQGPPSLPGQQFAERFPGLSGQAHRARPSPDAAR